MKFNLILVLLLLLAGCTEAGDPWHVAPEVEPEPECGDGECNGAEVFETCPDDCDEVPSCVAWEDALVVIEDNTCLNCHVGTNFGGLDLSTYDGIMAGGNNGAAVLDGDGAGSSLVTKLKTDTTTFGGAMPLGNADTVTDPDIGLLVEWIDGGARESCPDAACVPFEAALAILTDNTCLNCHVGTNFGGLDLSTHEGVMAGGNNGAAVLDGDGAGSSLVTKLRTDTTTFGGAMPLGNADTVQDADIQGLIDWINAGANDTCP